MRNARIRVEDLVLDGKNPRHDPVSGTRAAIQALLAEGAEKLVNLASDIAEYGLSPIDRFLVKPNEAGLFTVLEGNRRVAAMKLLANPALADGHRAEKQFRQIASDASIPEELDCAIAGSREEAKHWLELRHTGAREGRGVVPWSPEGQNRFSRRPGTQADRALLFIESLEQAYRDNDELVSYLSQVRRNKITTLGRLVSDPYFRQVVGVKLGAGGLLSHYSRDDLEPIFQRVLADLAGTLTVSRLKSKKLRKEYVDKVVPGLLEEASYDSSASPLNPPTMVGKGKRQKRKTKARAQAKKNLLEGLSLQNQGSKISNILSELQSLDVDSFPNSAALLLRAVLELSVAQVHNEKGWKESGELKKRVKRCLHEIDPSDKDDRFQAVRSGLQDGTSVLAVATLHGYVHNPHYHPSGTELRTIAANYEAFLEELDNLA